AEFHRSAVPAQDPEQRLLELMRGYRQPQALYVAVQLGIADRIGSEPTSADELANATGSHSRSLTRLLRALASSGVFIETAPGMFAHSPMSELLKRAHPNSRVPSVLFLGAAYSQLAWLELGSSIKTGRSSFQHVHGMSKWQYNQLHPEQGAVFDQVMAGARPGRIAALVGAYDFAGASLVVDIGGGHGQLLAAVLARHSHLQGVLYDLPEVVRGAPALLAQAGVEARCRVEGGSFLERVPAGDTYILSDILHDWPDEECLAILRACRAAISAGGRLLVVEYLLTPGATPPHVAWLDLQMLVEFGEGRQRSAEELGGLFQATGFRLVSVLPTSDVNIVVAEAID
ncbi:MAG TPA: methyltransferase, partial [Polyangiaceae bacterium]|nr:methyltransferase [Polyangiaceae bacterium]